MITSGFIFEFLFRGECKDRNCDFKNRISNQLTIGPAYGQQRVHTGQQVAQVVVLKEDGEEKAII
jgi:hypothetical protein